MGNICSQIAKNLREVFFGGNWTDVNIKDTLSSISYEDATAKVYSFNTIAVLVFHINYYIDRVIPVLKGEQLKATDKDAFSHPPINSEDEWKKMVDDSFKQLEIFASLTAS
jgi:hypothetical protein